MSTFLELSQTLEILAFLSYHSLITLQDTPVHHSTDSVNPLHDKSFIGNIKIYLQILSILHTEMTQVFEILPHVRQKLTYSA